MVLTTYKGFDKDLRCRDFQFEVGKSYNVTGTIVACQRGFHACESPFDVWRYYGPGNSRFAIVEQSGDLARDGSDTKIASGQITIKAELTLPEFIKRGLTYILDRVDWKNAKQTNSGYQSAATNTGDQSAATNTGDQSAATNTGYQSAAEVSGTHSLAVASGAEGKAKATASNGIVLVNRDPYTGVIRHLFASMVGENGIKADTWYTLGDDGKPVEVA